MLKINHIIAFIFLLLLFTSCKAQINADTICLEKFKVARELAYSNPLRSSALDSAMELANECIKYDSIRKAVIDFKITLYVSMNKYAEGVLFIDSLSEKDFTFHYKRNFMSMGLQALEHRYNNDSIKESQIYREIVNDIEHYIDSKKDIDAKEFIEVYTDLFTAKEKFLNASQINIEIDALKSKYPEKKSFFDFFKQE